MLRLRPLWQIPAKLYSEFSAEDIDSLLRFGVNLMIEESALEHAVESSAVLPNPIPSYSSSFQAEIKNAIACASRLNAPAFAAASS